MPLTGENAGRSSISESPIRDADPVLGTRATLHRSDRILRVVDREGIKPSATIDPCDNAMGAGFIPARS